MPPKIDRAETEAATGRLPLRVTIDPAEIFAGLPLLGLSARCLGAMCGVPETRVRQGKLSLGAVAAFRARVEHARAHPFPVEDPERFAAAEQRRPKHRPPLQGEAGAALAN